MKVNEESSQPNPRERAQSAAVKKRVKKKEGIE
jgi:hypothetical protein